jgi:carbonic anhydrase
MFTKIKKMVKYNKISNEIRKEKRSKMTTAPVVLISCMDFRLIDEMVAFMDDKGHRDEYDHLIFAGASLFLASDKKKTAWIDTFYDHLQLAIDLHAVEKVMIMDHRHCGAYNAYFGREIQENEDEETALHTQYMTILKQQILEKHPNLTVELFLLGLDGTAEKIA